MDICRQDSCPKLSENPLENTPVQSRSIHPPSAPFHLRPASFPDSPLSPLTPSPQFCSLTITAGQPLPTISRTQSGKSYTEAAPQPNRYHKPPQPPSTGRPLRNSTLPSSPVTHPQSTPPLAVSSTVLPPPVLVPAPAATTAPITAPSVQPPPQSTSTSFNTPTMSNTTAGF